MNHGTVKDHRTGNPPPEFLHNCLHPGWQGVEHPRLAPPPHACLPWVLHLRPSPTPPSTGPAPS
eukprot:scaffold101766_cov19-Tisochrysis_lutea.AAC.1